MSKIIAVVGGTGQQGSNWVKIWGGVVAELLKKKNNNKNKNKTDDWKIRALVRNPDSEKAIALKEKGVEIVKANLDNPEQLEKAFQGVYGVFLVTTFHNGGGVELEEREGKNAVDAAKKCNVSHFIFSSAQDIEKISGGKLKVAHYSSKARIAEYLSLSGVPFTTVQIAFFYENLSTYYMPKPNAQGVYQFTISASPDSKFPMASALDIGKVVVKILEDTEKYLGKSIPVSGDYLSVNEIAATLAKVWNKEVKPITIPAEVYSKLYFGASALADMYDFFEKFGYFGDRDIFEGKKIAPEIRTFEQFVRESFANPPVYKPDFNFSVKNH